MRCSLRWRWPSDTGARGGLNGGSSGAEPVFFALVGLSNGFAVLCWVQSLALGSVSLISPIVACYPVFTLLFGAVLMRRTAIAGNQIVGVILTVTGIVMLTGN